MALTQQELKEFFHYDPLTGEFTRAKTWYGKKKGRLVGMHHSEGYLYAIIKTKTYYLHRLAFLYMEGYIPENTVDHVNGVRDDNRWCNLRETSVGCQRQNTSRLSTNTTGYKGICFHAGYKKWGAQIIVREKHYWLGFFDCPIEAALTRLTFEDWCPHWNCDERSWNRDRIFAALKKAISEQDTRTWVYAPSLSKSNTSGYRGVKLDKRARTKPYRAQINHEGKRYYLGAFDTAELAAEARNNFIIKNNLPHELNLKRG